MQQVVDIIIPCMLCSVHLALGTGKEGIVVSLCCEGSIQWGRRGRSFYPKHSSFLLKTHRFWLTDFVSSVCCIRIFSTIPVVNIGSSNQDPSYCHTYLSVIAHLFSNMVYPNQKILDRALLHCYVVFPFFDVAAVAD